MWHFACRRKDVSLLPTLNAIKSFSSIEMVSVCQDRRHKRHANEPQSCIACLVVYFFPSFFFKFFCFLRVFF